MGGLTYLQPLTTLCLVLLALGIWRLWRRRRAGLAWGTLVLLFLLTWPPVDWLLSRPLEAGYRVRALPDRPAEAIVVLSSAVDPPKRQRPYAVPDQDTYRRSEFAAWLYRSWRPVPIYATGGSHIAHVAPVAVYMRELLVRAGVPPGRIVTEERARSTHESAVNTAAMLRAGGIRSIALVTDAQSMRRAEACFRRQGLDVVPAPSEFRELGWALDDVLPNWQSLERNERTLHELGGLAWYAISGRI